MDAYEFINSKDVREYLASQNYQLTSVQRAFLVWQSKRHTLGRKHGAWNDIINTLPDFPVEEGVNCMGWTDVSVYGFGAKSADPLSFGRKRHLLRI